MRKAREIRLRTGLSLVQIMVITGVDHSRLSRFERGTGNLRLVNVQKLAALYGCTLDDLLAEADPTEPEPVPA